MSRSKVRLLLGPALVPVLVTTFLFVGQSQPASPASQIKSKVIKAELSYELGQAKRPKWAQKVSSGAMYNALMASGLLGHAARGAKPATPSLSTTDTLGCPHTFTGGTGGNNTRVNQDCGLRRQAEEVIAVNPTNRRNLIAGQNDSRVGFNQCGFDWSFDGGVHWGDMIPPFHQVLLGNGHVGDFCSDPTVAFDSQGNAFAGGIEISIDFLDSAILVGRSDAGIGGAFYHNPDQSDPFHQYKNDVMGVVVETFDETGCVFNDKELMAADATAASPKADNVYMVWTRFDFCTDEGVGAHSPIYFSQSTDGGLNWSEGIEISGSNKKFCTVFSGESDPNACDQDQGGHPVVGPDGAVYVAFNNGNTPVHGGEVPGRIGLQPAVELDRTGEDQRRHRGGAVQFGVRSGDRLPGGSAVHPTERLSGGRLCLGFDLGRQLGPAVLRVDRWAQHRPALRHARLCNCPASVQRRRVLLVLHGRRRDVVGCLPGDGQRRGDRTVAALERRHTVWQHPVDRLLRPEVRRLRVRRLQRHHAGEGHPAEGIQDHHLLAAHHAVHAQPGGRQQPGPGRIHR